MATEEEVRDALRYVDPASLTYEEWLEVGMALKDDGHPCSLWDEWSRRDPDRYDGKCWAKWESLQSSGITIASLFQRAIDGGYRSATYASGIVPRELKDDEVIAAEDLYRVIDQDIDVSQVPKAPERWDQIDEARRYLEALFDPDDHVSYCTQCYKDNKGKYHPSGRSYDRTAERLIHELDEAKTIEDVFYDYDQECGVWVSFNPMDGRGGAKENVTHFRYALIESDTQDLNVQYSLMKELRLPIAALVHSGNKSIHAIVRIDAETAREYAARVDQLFRICQKNGLEIDTSTKNPSRLSRFPGFWRAGKKQYLIDTNLGCKDWAEWIEYIESINDDLPDPEDFSEVWDNLPELAPELISGVLRKGHKMLLAGGSKTGKSMLMIELAIAIASGTSWLGMPCQQGKVMYVNLEIDRASFARRIDAAGRQRAISPEKIGKNLIVWNLRGHSSTLDKLAPKLIRRCAKGGFEAVIIDPVYKVMMGDENKAGDMAAFCNQFDRIATELQCSVIYVHHFSKGDQDKKASIDRASGSGVFARDPDAIVTVTKLSADEPAVRTEFTLREFPDKQPINAWYRYPIHVVDDTGELSGKRIAGAKAEKKSHKQLLIEFTDMMHIAYQNHGYDEDGKEVGVSQPDMVKAMSRMADREISARDFSRKFDEAVEEGLTDLRKENRNKKSGKSTLIIGGRQ